MEITHVPFTTGQLIGNDNLSRTLELVPEEERQRAIMLAKQEAAFIAQTLFTSADMIRILEGRPGNDASP